MADMVGLPMTNRRVPTACALPVGAIVTALSSQNAKMATSA